MSSEPVRLSGDDLADLFLFESLDDDQRAWLAERGWCVEYAAGERVFAERDPATCFYVLLEGAVSLRRNVRGTEIEITSTWQRGAYSGATQAYVDQADARYANSMVAVEDTRLFVIAADDFGSAVREWFPMAVHLLEGLFFGLRASDQIVGQRERLIALGQLSAGLTHELNNPAAAAVRATSRLRERVAAMRHKLGGIASGKIDGETLRRLTTLQEEAVDRVGKRGPMSPMEAADAEDALAERLEDLGVRDAWDLAPTLVQAGVDDAFLDRVAEEVPLPHREGSVRWLTYTLESELLMNEIDDATTRISTLVSASKQYSALDRAPHQEVDVHEGIESTLVMMTSRIGPGVTVVKDFDRTLPHVACYPAELNQVWTNLVDNAVDAMDGAGTLTIRTSRRGASLAVDVTDTGPGVPEAIRRQVFEPFFTTKPVGRGTGLGLDISRRIVVDRHGGDLVLESEPGRTTFTVLLPLAAAGAP